MVTPLHVIHAPAWTKKLAQLPDPAANRRMVPEVARSDLAQPLEQPRASHAVFQGCEPAAELFSSDERIHGMD